MPVGRGYQAIRAAVLAGVDRAFAEPVRLSFMKKDAVDAGRPACEISAVLRVGGGDESNLAGGFAQDWRTKLAAGKAELHIDRAANPSLVVRPNDRVQAISRPGRPWFQVLRVDDRGDTRLVLALGEV